MRYTMEELDVMEGHAFEYAVADLLRHNGWRDVSVTQGSGDYGADILARRGTVRYAIQCKRHEGSIGVAAVREAASGAEFYHYDAAAVITNSTYTKRAITLADETGVRHWGREFLEDLIENYDDEYDIIDPQIATEGLRVNENSQQSTNSKGVKTAKNTKSQNNNLSQDRGIELAKNIYSKNGQIYFGKDKITYKGMNAFRIFLICSVLLVISLSILLGIVEPFLGLLGIVFGIMLLRYAKRIKNALVKYDKLKEQKQL